MEEWRDIQGYEGLYQASSKGNIRSLDRIVDYGNGHSQTCKGTLMKPQPDKDGYSMVSLSKEKTKKTHKSHRLVAITFIENPLNLRQVNHIDGDKKNNAVENIEWVNASENLKHAFRVLNVRRAWTGKFGADNPNSKPVIVGGVRYAGVSEAARKIGCFPTEVSKAARRSTRVRGMKAEFESISERVTA